MPPAPRAWSPPTQAQLDSLDEALVVRSGDLSPEILRGFALISVRAARVALTNSERLDQLEERIAVLEGNGQQLADEATDLEERVCVLEAHPALAEDLDG